MRRRVALVVLSLLCGPAASLRAEPVAPEDAAAARATVVSLHAVLIGCMKEADALGFQGRYDRILANLDQTFDLPFMARTALGSRTWKQLDAQQRREFVGLSRQLSATQYADNFSGYGGERFETLSEEPAARSTLLVMTRLLIPDDDDVAFDYRRRNLKGQWRIIDVQLDGKISELALRRSQYRSLAEREGYDALVAAVERKIEQLSSD